MTTDDTRRSDGQGLSEEEREALDEGLWGGRIHDDVPFLVARIKADAYAAGLAARGGNTDNGLRAALADLVALKDGPRDDDYYRRKSAAWSAARDALAAPAPTEDASMIASLRARLDKVSDLAESRNDSALREALNGYTRSEQPKCEGRTPFDCGNPFCPVHAAPAPTEPYVWTRNDQTDHDAGHPSGYDCDGYAMAASEACGKRFPAPTDNQHNNELADRVRAELDSEDAHAVLFGVTGTHPASYGGVTKDEALECATELLTRLRAVVDGATTGDGEGA